MNERTDEVQVTRIEQDAEIVRSHLGAAHRHLNQIHMKLSSINDTTIDFEIHDWIGSIDIISSDLRSVKNEKHLRLAWHRLTAKGIDNAMYPFTKILMKMVGGSMPWVVTDPNSKEAKGWHEAMGLMLKVAIELHKARTYLGFREVHQR